jgi:hypothetical protein
VGVGVTVGVGVFVGVGVDVAVGDGVLVGVGVSVGISAVGMSVGICTIRVAVAAAIAWVDSSLVVPGSSTWLWLHALRSRRTRKIRDKWAIDESEPFVLRV